MKTLPLLAGAAVLALSSVGAEAQDKLTLQLKWVTQAQFAGYYVAKDKGFYKEDGLDVTIKPGGPDIAPEQVLAGGGADVVVDWMPGALAAREKGVPMVNIAQPFKRSGLELTCRADTGIKTPQDLKGRTLGVWFSGNEYPFLNWMAKLHFKTDGSPGGVKVLKQNFNVEGEPIDLGAFKNLAGRMRSKAFEAALCIQKLESSQGTDKPVERVAH